MTYRAVIIGCGTIAPKHADALSELGIELCAVCDTDKQRSVSFAKRYGAKPYTDYELMIKEQKPSAVHICLPHYLHAQAARFALQNGCRVFLEKPPVMRRQELRLVDDDGVTVCFQNRFNPSTEYAKKLIEDKPYGALVGAVASTMWCRKPDYYQNSDWRGTKAKEGGGVLINQSIHALDMLTYLLGRPKTVSAAVSNLDHPYIEVEDSVSAVIGFEKAPATFFATTCNVASPATEYTLYFENETVVFDGYGVRTKNGQLLFGGYTKTDAKAYYGDSHKILIDKFYKSFESGENPCSVQSCKDTMNLLFDIYEKGDHR